MHKVIDTHLLDKACGFINQWLERKQVSGLSVALTGEELEEALEAAELLPEARILFTYADVLDRAEDLEIRVSIKGAKELLASWKEYAEDNLLGTFADALDQLQQHREEK